MKHKMDFPYYYKYNPLTVDEILKLLRSYNPIVLKQDEAKKLDVEKLKDKYVVFLDSYEKYKHINSITNLFSEKCRMKCSAKDSKMSPYEYYKYNKNKIRHKAFKKYGDTSYKSLKEILYRSIPECSLFNITVVINVLKLFNVKTWLDISAGWGDRLIGAIACDVDKYVGVDPSMCMKDKYEKIINTLVDKDDRHKFIVINAPFEDAELPDMEFDIVFTSPPFFDFERYTDDKTQSIKKFNTCETWIQNFLFVSVKKAWNKLKKGKVMVLYVGNSKICKYTSRLKEMINTELHGEYLGKVYYYIENNKRNKTRGMFVWKKYK